MRLNGIELSKDDAEAIITELKECKSIHDCSKEEQDFIKECLRIAKEWK